MDRKPEIEAVVQRAWDARKTIGEVCAEAKVIPATWSRARGEGKISVATLRKMESALDRIEAKG